MDITKRKMTREEAYELARRYQEIVQSEVVYDEENEVIVFKDPKKGQRVPQHYKCPSCGRIKTVRFNYTPTPASCGICPRCNKASMIAILNSK